MISASQGPPLYPRTYYLILRLCHQHLADKLGEVLRVRYSVCRRIILRLYPKEMDRDTYRHTGLASMADLEGLRVARRHLQAYCLAHCCRTLASPRDRTGQAMKPIAHRAALGSPNCVGRESHNGRWAAYTISRACERATATHVIRCRA